MNLDVRFPIGLMFSLFGAILIVMGFVVDQSVYDQHSLGVNINLYWGCVLLLFGLLMLVLAWRGRDKWKQSQAESRKRASPPTV